MQLAPVLPAQKVKACNDKQTKNIIGSLQAKKIRLVLVCFAVSDDDVNTTITDASHISSD